MSAVQPQQRALHLVAVVLDVLGVAFAGAIGFVVGAVLTFTHRLSAPWGLVLAFAIVLALIAGFRLGAARIPPTACPESSVTMRSISPARRHGRAASCTRQKVRRRDPRMVG